MALKLPKLDKTMHVVVVKITDPRTGKVIGTGYGTADPDFQRWWQSSVIKSDSGVSLQSLSYDGSAPAIYDAGALQSVMDKVHEICLALSGS